MQQWYSKLLAIWCGFWCCCSGLYRNTFHLLLPLLCLQNWCRRKATNALLFIMKQMLRDTFSSIQRLPYTVRAGSKLNLFIKFNTWESFLKSFRDNPRSTKIPKPCSTIYCRKFDYWVRTFNMESVNYFEDEEDITNSITTDEAEERGKLKNSSKTKNDSIFLLIKN